MLALAPGLCTLYALFLGFSCDLASDWTNGPGTGREGGRLLPPSWSLALPLSFRNAMLSWAALPEKAAE